MARKHRACISFQILDDISGSNLSWAYTLKTVAGIYHTQIKHLFMTESLSEPL